MIYLIPISWKLMPSDQYITQNINSDLPVIRPYVARNIHILSANELNIKPKLAINEPTTATTLQPNFSINGQATKAKIIYRYYFSIRNIGNFGVFLRLVQISSDFAILLKLFCK